MIQQNPARVTFTETKFYNKTQVRKRVMAYKDAFEELSGCTAKESTMGWNSEEGGMVKIPINGGYNRSKGQVIDSPEESITCPFDFNNQIFSQKG